MFPDTTDGISLAGSRRRTWPAIIAGGGLLLLLGTLAVAIVLSQASARSQIRSSFALRGKASASSVSTFVAEQGAREQEAAERFLATPRPDRHDLEVVTTTFGSTASIVLNASGRVIAAQAPNQSLRETALVSAVSNLATISSSEASASNVFYAPDAGAASTAITVPYASAGERRVLSADYPATDLGLAALVDHAIPYPQHMVYLVDATGRIVTSSPLTSAVLLAHANPRLAQALAQSRQSAVGAGHARQSFTSAPVPGTPWRLVIEVPDWKLYESISGWQQYVPWLVFALVTVLGALLVWMFTRSLVDRARLTALSGRMRRTAQTDSLTGLNNRRALTEQLTRAGAHARRHEEPLSVMMIDLDRFKQTNDTFGHEAGDQVLCTVADCMREVLRAEDVFGRWGGDEFLVALPGADADGARATAERLRAAAAAIALGAIGLPDGVPLSIGVTTGVHESPNQLVRDADEALYRVKAARREQRDERDDVLVSR